MENKLEKINPEELETNPNSKVFKYTSRGVEVVLEISIGDFLLSSSHAEIKRVIGFEDTEYGGRVLYKVEFGQWEKEGYTSASDLSYYRVIKGIDLKEMKSIAKKIMKGKFDIKSLKPQESNISSTSLMKVDEDYYNRTLAVINEQENKVSIIQAIIKAKTDAIRSKIDGVLRIHNKIISRLNSIVFTLKLYAGINESVKQIQVGQEASEDEPIHLNQLMRFMDEEVGDPSNGGISYNNLEDFDNWLLAKNTYLKCFNYELLLPQKKSVRIMRVRRKVSERYSSDPFNNRWEIAKEMNTYILIRNGENIYTIDSIMQFSDALYPNQDELTAIVNLKDEDAKYDKLERYKNGMVLMQGLIDRTTIFGDLAGKFSFMNTDAQEQGKVVYQYEIDDDHLITDGTKTFLDFLNTDTIEAGDRILIVNPYNQKGDRLFGWYGRDSYVPPSPETGIYKLDYDKKEKVLHFSYLPDDDVYDRKTGYSSPRKNKLRYKVYPKDGNIVNIDRVSHRDLDWINNMMYDRRDRREYLRSAGLLFAIKKFKNLEIEEERPFMLMICQATKCSELDSLDAIHWWKTKNKHKRALSVDDQKAFRMIVKYLKNKDNAKS